MDTSLSIKKYRQAAIAVSICSIIYLFIFLWKGISIKYGTAYFVSMLFIIFFITVVPYFVYKGSKGWARTFAWIYLLRALGTTYAIYSGTQQEIMFYVVPLLYVCSVVLFWAITGDRQQNINKCKCEM